MSLTFIVFFEDPFWVGLFTLDDRNSSAYCRVVFGQEPSDIEVYQYFLRNYYLLEFFPAVRLEDEKTSVKNPKRRQREISKEVHNRIGTKKSWEAVKLIQQQSRKKKKHEENKALKAERENYLFNLKQQKYKEKHRGY
jgi:hypothetical protein